MCLVKAFSIINKYTAITVWHFYTEQCLCQSSCVYHNFLLKLEFEIYERLKILLDLWKCETMICCVSSPLCGLSNPSLYGTNLWSMNIVMASVHNNTNNANNIFTCKQMNYNINQTYAATATHWHLVNYTTLNP